MNEHTPGPWSVGRRMPEEGVLISGAEGAPVCVVTDETTLYGQLYGIPSEANAALIAAAPDLLEACKWASAWITQGRGQNPMAELIAAHDKLRAAIAKAEKRMP